ncbi:MAG: hypothetical protein IIB81_01700 [Nanoarchaeota archaeon]|nr:hypothetical protein [Nanoarchaeota archaeon]
MALFDNKKPFSYDVIREGDDVILSVNLEDYPRVPSLEDEPVVMSKACDMLIEVKDATKIVYIQKRNYEYDYEQTLMLSEIAKIQNNFVKQKIN